MGTRHRWKLLCAGFILTGAGIVMLFSDVILRAQDALPDPPERIEATCNGAPLPPGKQCCRTRFGERVFDPMTHGCCADGTYNSTDQGCCKTKLTYTKGPGVKCCSTPQEVTRADGSTTWECAPAIATPPQKCCNTVSTKTILSAGGGRSEMRLACDVVWNPATECCCKVAQIIINQPCVMP